METEEERQEREDREFVNRPPSRLNKGSLNFGIDTSTLEGKRAYARAYQKRLKENFPEKYRNNFVKFNERKKKTENYFKERHLRVYHGITLQDKAKMVELQNGKCAICGCNKSFDDLWVDHNHYTGRIRGLLCSECNTGLGMFQDDPVILEKAKDYIIKNVNLDLSEGKL